MPDASDQTKSMLSSWSKEPKDSIHSVQPSVNAKKTKEMSRSSNVASKQQWSAIFNKPHRSESNEEQSTMEMQINTITNDISSSQISDENTQPDLLDLPTTPDSFSERSLSMNRSKKRRHINPHSPFSSFVVTLQTPKGMVFPFLSPQSQHGCQLDKQSNDVLSFDNLLSPSTHQSDVESLSELSSQSSTQPDNSVENKRPVSSFFAKRPTKATFSKAVTTSRPKKVRPPSFYVDHVRSERTWNHQTLTKRHCARHTHDHEYDNKLNPLSDMIERDAQALISSKVFLHNSASVHTPVRRLMGPSQVSAIASRSQSKISLPQTDDLCKTAGELQKFDLGQFETRMWSDKYVPKDTDHHFCPDSAKSVYSWLHTQQGRIKKPVVSSRVRRAKRKSTSDDFVVEDGEPCESEDEDESAILIISGPSGSGKTSSVYAAANELACFVFEVNCGVRRTGKELSGMLEGISRNHAVHSAKNVVILVDDADIVYENEAGTFWPTITKFATISRRPVVITCTDPSLVSLVPSVPYETVNMIPPNLIVVTDLAWTIALNEGHILDKQRLASMVVQFRGDLRRTLTTLQFWCQFGIGGKASGVDWVPKLNEFHRKCHLKTHDRKSNKMISSGSDTEDEYELDAMLEWPRVISDGTWFPLPHEQAYDNETQFSSYLFDSDFDAHIGTMLDEVESRSNDSIWTNTALPMSHWQLPIRLPPQENYVKSTKATIDPYSFYCLSTRENSFALDVAPFMRIMVVSDAQRQLGKNAASANLSDREQRTALRSMKEMGIDTRNYMGFNLPMMTSIINTGFKRPSPSSYENTGTSILNKIEHET